MDYKKLGLRCGIEVHQQLETKKLFCDCPSLLRDDDPHYKIIRQLRATAGETGEIDIAALHEQRKAKTYVYEGYHDTTCLVETDSEPPHEMNKDALNACLQTSLLLKAKIVDEIQVMRKTVVDGSNTTGFQRTALVARNGSIETSEGKVTIPTLSIEEDSAKIIGREPHQTTYRLDRLGIPLIEIGTNPDIKSPQQAQEVAAYIGMVLRSTGKVKRGLGTIRQDVNVSIKDGARIEIKGAQDLKLVPTYVEYEVVRQQNLIDISKKIGKLNLKKELVDVSDIFKKSESKIIKSALQKKGIILAIKLPNFKGFIGQEIQPGRRLGTEFSDRAKVAAGVGGIFHSDELPKYGITEDDMALIIKKLKCDNKDAFVLVADRKETSELALTAVYERVLECDKVPREVRKANPDGTTSFLRPMPGAARLYPETDVPPIIADIKNIELPKLLSDTKEDIEKRYNLSADLAQLITKSGKHELFESFAKKFKKIKPSFIAETIVSIPREIRRKFDRNIDNLTDKQYEEILSYLSEGKISKDVIIDVLIDYSEGKFSLDKYKTMSDDDLEKEIKKIIAENKNAPENALIGIVMGQLKGKAPGKKIVEMIKKITS